MKMNSYDPRTKNNVHMEDCSFTYPMWGRETLFWAWPAMAITLYYISLMHWKKYFQI